MRPHTVQEFPSSQTNQRIDHISIMNSLLWKNLERILIVQVCLTQRQPKRIRDYSDLFALRRHVCCRLLLLLVRIRGEHWFYFAHVGESLLWVEG